MAEKGQKKRTPQIRFRGFVEEWEEKALGELAESMEYGLNAAAMEYDGVNKYIRITDIDDASRNFNTNNLTTPNINIGSAENYKLKVGDILFARTGASVGKTYIYKESDGLVYFAGFLIRARIKAKFNSEFVFQKTLTEKYEKFIKVFSQRSGQPGVNAQEYSVFSILTPTPKEQTKIGNFFQRLDNLITLRGRKLEKLVKIKKAMLEKMFPKEGADVPEIRFGGFTDPWEKRELGEVVQTIGTGKSSFTSDTNRSDKRTYAILGSTSIIGYDSKFDYTGSFILTARVGANAGNIYQYSGDVKISDNTVFIQGDNLKFIFYLLLKFDLKKLSFGTGQPLIKSSELSSLQLLFPPKKEEQTKIGNFFQHLDNLISLQRQELDKLKKIKKSSLEKMFV